MPATASIPLTEREIEMLTELLSIEIGRTRSARTAAIYRSILNKLDHAVAQEG